MGRQFPSSGGKEVAHEKRPLNIIFNIHITRSSNQLEIVVLSKGEARAAVVWAVPGNPHGTGVSRILGNRGKRGCRRRGPPPGRRRSPRTRGGGSGGCDPSLCATGAAPGRVKGGRQNDTLTLPSADRSLHSDPLRKGRQADEDAGIYRGPRDSRRHPIAGDISDSASDTNRLSRVMSRSLTRLGPR